MRVLNIDFKTPADMDIGHKSNHVQSGMIQSHQVLLFADCSYSELRVSPSDTQVGNTVNISCAMLNIHQGQVIENMSLTFGDPSQKFKFHFQKRKYLKVIIDNSTAEFKTGVNFNRTVQYFSVAMIARKSDQRFTVTFKALPTHSGTVKCSGDIYSVSFNFEMFERC